ncbi:DUF4129 domain-containing protein [Kitasatospora sp. NPDC054939]
MSIWGEAGLAAGGAPITVPRDPAREAAEQELVKADYHRHDPNLLERLFDWFTDRLDEALGALAGDGVDGTTGLILFGVVAVIVAGAVWWRLGAPRRAARSEFAVFGRTGPRTAAEHRAEADLHAAAGRWAEAVREQMRAIVRGLEERTLLDPRPGRTADEAAAEAGRALPEHAAALAAAARTFDDIAYGERTADQAAHQLLRDLDRALERARPAAAAAPVPAGAAAPAPAPAQGGPA